MRFVRDEHDLSASVARHLEAALVRGAPALLVATPSHLPAIEASLGGGGALTTLDAHATLARILVDGRPDARRFDAEVGARVRALARGGMPVIFGEMVWLLWEAGMVGAALELESHWNALADEVAFDLLCAYPLAAADPDALPHVCAHHSDLASPLFALEALLADGDLVGARGFPPLPGAPRDARAFAADVLRAVGLRHLTADAALVVSELATNAVAHARSGFTLELASSGAHLALGVHDHGERAATLDAEPTHGLGIVAALAERWGAERPPGGGTTVWAVLAR